MPGQAERPRYFGDHFPDFDKSFKFPFTLFANGDVDAREGLGADGVIFGKFTTANYVAYALEYDDSAATDSEYSDVTADLNATGTEEVFTDDQVNDALYLGEDYPFAGLLIDMGTAGTDLGGGPTVAIEYWNGTAWTAFSELIDDSAGLTAGTSNYVVSWKMPTDWAKTDVGDAQASFSDKYWARIRVTTAQYDVEPVIASVSVFSVVAADGITIPFNGYLESVYMTADTEADDDDMDFNIINISSGEFTTVLLDDDSRVEASDVAATKGLYFKKGQKMLVQATTTASTELANVNFVFVFRV